MFVRWLKRSLLPLSLLLTPVLLACGPTEQVSVTNQSEGDLRGVWEGEPKPFRESEIYFERDPRVEEGLVYKPLRYLAIGDSVSQGFMSVPFAAFPGSFDGVDVKGASFPAYLADLINRAQPGKLASFTNLSLSGSRVIDWLYYLDKHTYPQYRDTARRKYEINQLVSLNKVSEFSDNMTYFDEHSDPEFSRLKEVIRGANFMTIGLGGNSGLFSFINYGKRLWSFLNSNRISSIQAQDIDALFKQAVYDMERVINEELENYTALVKLIKSINKDIRIVLVGYPPHPILNVEEILTFLFKRDLKLLPMAFLRLRDVIKRVAEVTNVSYVNLYSDRALEEDMLKTTTFLDFHPGTRIAKWMAQQVFLKIAMPINVFESYIIPFNISDREGWLGSDSQEYVDYDLGSFRKEIYLSPLANQRIAWLAKERFNDYWIEEEQALHWTFHNPRAPEFINNSLRGANYANLEWFIAGIRSAIRSFPSSPPSKGPSLIQRLLEQWGIVRRKPKIVSQLNDLKAQLADLLHTIKGIFISNDKDITFVNVAQRWLEIVNDPVVLLKIYHI